MQLTSRILFCLLSYLVSTACLPASAQVTAYHMAVLAPVYLDSTFDASGGYRLGDQFPHYAAPGLEFMEGAALALDTLQAQGGVLTASFFDVRSAATSVPQLLASHKLDSMQLLVGSVSGDDYLLLAEFAGQKNIPFVSATYPNDGGITRNPFVIILNGTLQTHCTAIYHYLLKSHPTDNLLYVRQPGPMEDRLAGYFRQLNDDNGKPLLKIQTVITGDSVRADSLQAYLDSTRHTVIIAGSLDEAYGVSLLRACGTLQNSYPLTLVGMPSWEGARALQAPDLRGVPYLFTTSFILPMADSTSDSLSFPYRFNALARTHPGDQAYLGYESTFLFGNLLLHYGAGLLSHVGEIRYQTYMPLDIRPTFLATTPSAPDYFENQQVYLLKRQNGVTTRIQ